MKEPMIMKSLRVLGLISLVTVLSMLSSCSSTGGLSFSSKPEDFDKFYDRFHQDINFQMSRLRFPLEGGYTDGNQTLAWNKKNWIQMKEKIYDIDRSTYRVNYKKTDDSFYQRVWLDNAGFSAEYRFQLIGRKWYLVYASDKNL